MGPRQKVAIALLVAWVVAGYSWQPELSISGDNAQYMLIAESLRNGDGFTINDEPATKYPPGFPLLLSVMEGWEKYPALIGYLGLVAAMTYWCGWPGAILTIFEPHLILFSSQELPETLFALLVFVAFMSGWWWLLLIATYLKTVGVVFLVAYMVLKRESLVKRTAISAIVFLPLVAMNLWYGSAYASQFFAVTAYYPEAGTIGVVDCLKRSAHHLGVYTFWGGPLWLGMNWVAFLYLPVMLLWPWGAHRLLVPAIPFLIHRITKFKMPLWPVISFTLVFYLFEWGNVSESRWSPAWQGYHNAAMWIGKNTDTTARICARKADWLQQVSKRSAYCYPFVDEAEVIRFFEAKDIDYVVLDQLPFTSTERHLVPAVIAYEKGWELMYESNDTAVLRRLK